MYTAVGTLSPETAQAAHKALPSCYTDRFDECMDDANRYARGCKRYEPVHLAFKQDAAAARAMLDDMDYCDASTGKLWLYAGVAGVAGAIVGLLIAKRA